MKKKLLGIAILCAINGMSISKLKAQEEIAGPRGGNIMKMNLFSWLGSTYSVEYERQISSKISSNTTISHVPVKKLPFQSLITKVVDDENMLKKSRLGAFSAAQEFRFYLGEGALKGFYIAPFVKYGRYNVKVNIDTKAVPSVKVPEEEKFQKVQKVAGLSGGISDPTFLAISQLPDPSSSDHILVKGPINTYTAGVSFGVQWNLGKFVYLDWRILGPSYGIGKGTLEANKDLTSEQQANVKQQLDNLTDEIPVLKIDNSVSSTGVKSTIDGPWAGVRTGLSLGYRF